VFLRELAEQSGGAGKQGEAAQHGDRQVEVGQRGPADTGTVERQGSAQYLWVDSPDRFVEAQVVLAQPFFLGDAQQHRCAGVTFLVNGVPEAGHIPLGGSPVARRSARTRPSRSRRWAAAPDVGPERGRETGRLSHNRPAREDTIGNRPGPPDAAAAPSRPRSSSGCASRCRAALLSASSSCSPCAEPTCSIRRAAPRRAEYTICTAVAPDAVFTVRTYATEREATRSG
jgi:hypothetical protein